MKRIYETALRDHLREERQMAFVAGPRQIGKTTLLHSLIPESRRIMKWDQPSDCATILQGSDAVLKSKGLNDLRSAPSPRPVMGFDGLFKYRHWKRFLKGLFDASDGTASIVVTSSARLNIYMHGGDSLMGRYFLYRMHPLSVAEIAASTRTTREVVAEPVPIEPIAFHHLYRFGGFPEPFTRGSERFHRHWSGFRLEQLFREDLRELTRVEDIDQILRLSQLLTNQVGQLANYSSLAGQVSVAVDTIRRWLTVLENFYYSFRVQPWVNNVARSLRKQPKLYLWDWSSVADTGARCKCFAACHLLKAVHWWNDLGLGTYALHYVRDTAKREVDFLVTRNEQPWMLVEIKNSPGDPISPALQHFAQVLRIPHAFQAVLEMDYVDADCFAASRPGTPLRVPLRTLLSQLV